MKIVICDDDNYFIQQLVEYVRKCEEETHIEAVVYAFQDVEGMLGFLKENTEIDLIFLDVVFSSSEGMQAAREIRRVNQKIKIVFVSSYVEFAIQGYEVDAAAYLLKPVTYEVFKEKMLTISEKLKSESCAFFCDSTDKGTVFLDVNEIVYIETYGRNVKIHTKKETYIGRCKMKEYEKMLREADFYRCHAAYIVNLTFIKRIDKLTLVLKDGTELAISKARKRQFMTQFIKYTSSLIGNMK